MLVCTYTYGIQSNFRTNPLLRGRENKLKEKYKKKDFRFLQFATENSFNYLPQAVLWVMNQFAGNEETFDGVDSLWNARFMRQFVTQAICLLHSYIIVY